MHLKDLTGTREILWSPSLRKPVREPGDQNPGPSWAALTDGGSETSSAVTVPAGESTSPPGWVAGSRSAP
jgi:hypothetical protein